MNKLSQTDNLQTSLLIIFLVLISFPLSSFGSVQVDQIQLLGLLVLLVIFYHRFLFPRVAQKNRRLALYIEILPFLLLVPLLLLATGGFLSPLLIVGHLTAISLAILINPFAAVSFLVSLLGVLVLHFLVVLHPNTNDFTQVIGENLSLIVVSFLSFLATIPLFSLFSGHEKTRTEWFNYLDKQISTSEAQEKALLANLEDAIMVVNPKGFIVMMNQKMEELTQYSQVEALGKAYSEVLKLEDVFNQQVTSTPLTRVLSTNKSLILKDLHFENKKHGIKAKVKFSPIKDRTGLLLGILIVVANATSATEIASIQNDALSLALFKFNTLLSDARSYNATLLEDKDIAGPPRQYADRLMHLNQDLLRLSEDFLFSVRLSQEEVGIGIKEVDLAALLEEILTALDALAQKEKVTHKLTEVKKVTIRTDGTLLKKALTNLMVIATRLSEDKTIVGLDMVQEGDKLRLFINFQTPVPDLDIRSLREKFFGGGELFTNLPKANGLEVYLAENILELLGGSLSIAKNPKNYKQIEFLAELPLS
jgi:PAS domain S-box-containing protein